MLVAFGFFGHTLLTTPCMCLEWNPIFSHVLNSHLNFGTFLIDKLISVVVFSPFGCHLKHFVIDILVLSKYKNRYILHCFCMYLVKKHFLLFHFFVVSSCTQWRYVFHCFFIYLVRKTFFIVSSCTLGEDRFFILSSCTWCKFGRSSKQNLRIKLFLRVTFHQLWHNGGNDNSCLVVMYMMCSL